MRFKSGLAIGLAVGYYFGAKAGRERYLQIDQYLAPIRGSDAYQQLVELSRDLLGQSVSATRRALRDATAPDGAILEIRRAG